MTRMDDDCYGAIYLGMGYASCTSYSTRTPKERRAIKKKQPIGFVHFKPAKAKRKKRK